MEFVNPYTIIDIPLLELIRNLAIGLIIAVIWSYVITKTTRLIVDTRQYLPMFLMLIPSMILIITVIKTSIALSLGLVGALSIVRFRTPIKEPEELMHIFIAIAIGLGLGANQVLPTILGFAIIVIAKLPYILDKTKNMKTYTNFIDIVLYKIDKDIKIGIIEDILNNQKFKYKIKRIYETEENVEILIEASSIDIQIFEKISNDIKKLGLKSEISITDNARIIT